MTALSSLVGPLGLEFKDRAILRSQLIPWAIRCGTRCSNLMNIYYEKHFEEDLETFRAFLKFEPCISSAQNCIPTAFTEEAANSFIAN